MGYTKEQITFMKKYEKQIKEILEESHIEERKNKNDKKLYEFTIFASIVFVILGFFFYYLFKCKIVLDLFNVKYFCIEICFELAIWGVTNIIVYLLLKKFKYRFIAYFISSGISFIISYILIGIFDFKIGDNIDFNSIIAALLILLLFMLYILKGTKIGKKQGIEKSIRDQEFDDAYRKVFLEPRHYDNKESINKMQKDKRKINRKKKK